MNGYIIGIGLIVAGALLFFFGRLRSKRPSVYASRGSVAVGGDNNAPITNINTDSHKEHGRHGHGITILSIVVEIIGIAVVIWHAMHLVAK